jgi:hypothetical protein
MTLTTLSSEALVATQDFVKRRGFTLYGNIVQVTVKASNQAAPLELVKA